jgi:hypothetical protein
MQMRMSENQKRTDSDLEATEGGSEANGKATVEKVKAGAGEGR